MRNFYHSCKFCTLIINLAELWPWQILLYITVFAVRLRNLLNASPRCLNKDNLTWWYVLKIFWRHLCKMSLRCLGDVLKASSKRLEDVLKMFLQDVLKTFWRRLGKTTWRCLQVFKTSWRRFEDFLKTFWRFLEDILKMSWRCFCKTYRRRYKNVLKTSWKDVLKTSWRHMTKTNILVLIKTSRKRLEDVIWRRKTSSSRRMVAGIFFNFFSVN